MRILKALTIIALYELTKEVTYQIITRVQADDEIDEFPTDYEISKWR